MTTFTEQAEKDFYDGVTAGDRALFATKEVDKLDNMTTALQALCQGLANLSRGLRATYIRIDQLESTIRQLEHRGGGLLGR
jgi:hypothetical protein